MSTKSPQQLRFLSRCFPFVKICGHIRSQFWIRYHFVLLLSIFLQIICIVALLLLSLFILKVVQNSTVKIGLFSSSRSAIFIFSLMEVSNHNGTPSPSSLKSFAASNFVHFLMFWSQAICRLPTPFLRLIFASLSVRSFHIFCFLAGVPGSWPFWFYYGSKVLFHFSSWVALLFHILLIHHLKRSLVFVIVQEFSSGVSSVTWLILITQRYFAIAN